MSEQGFDPGRYLTKVSGKDYLEVKWRLVWLREAHPDAVIETEVVRVEPDFALFKATVSLRDGGSATGYGSETYGDFGDFIEKAETKAVGRALGMLGYGTQFCDDFDFGADRGRVVDSPIDFASTRGRRMSSNEPPPNNEPPPDDGYQSSREFAARQQARPEQSAPPPQGGSGFNRGGSAPGGGGGRNAGAVASARQVEFIRSLWTEKGMDENEGFDELLELYGVTDPTLLPKPDASKYIERLQSRQTINYSR